MGVKALRLIAICIAIICINTNPSSAHVREVLNEVNHEIRNTFRDFFNSLHHHHQHKPRWYHEHHRPEHPYAYYPRESDFEPMPVDVDANKPEVYPDEFIPKENPENKDIDIPTTPSTTPSTTTSTTTTTTTTTTTPAPSMETKPTLATPRRRADVPEFPEFGINPRIQPDDLSEKPGYCPLTPKGPWVCSSRCALDSDCRGTRKCCRNRCGANACVAPEFDNIF